MQQRGDDSEVCESRSLCGIMLILPGQMMQELSGACRVGAETLLKVYGVKLDPEEFSAFAGMGEVSLTKRQHDQCGHIICIDKLQPCLMMRID